MGRIGSKQRRTLRAIFAHPVSANIRWRDIEGVFRALGAEVENREGSRVAVIFPGRPPAVFHRPHPSPNTDKGAVAAVRDWLRGMGVDPQE
jgi:hypothetical protein